MGVRGASLCGHWKDELAALEKGFGALERQRRDFKETGQARPAPRYQPAATTAGGHALLVIHHPVTSAPAWQPLTITADVRASGGVKWVRLRYRSVNQHLDYQTLPLLPTGAKDQFQAVIPTEQIAPTCDLMYFIEAMDQQWNGTIHPDLNKETPYIVVKLQR